MKMLTVAALATSVVLSATSVSFAQATTGDQNSGVDARSHPSTTTSTQSSTQSGADLGTGMSPANNNPSATGHDNSGMRTDARTTHSTISHRRHRATSHTAMPAPSDTAPGDTDTGGTPR